MADDNKDEEEKKVAGNIGEADGGTGGDPEWDSLNASRALNWDAEERAAGRPGLTDEERAKVEPYRAEWEKSRGIPNDEEKAAIEKARQARASATQKSDLAAANSAGLGDVTKEEAAAMALGGIKGVGRAGHMGESSPAQWGIKEWQGIAERPQAAWDATLAAQANEAQRKARTERVARSNAMVEQLINARNERVNAQNAAVQAREDEFSALASLCYDPQYGQQFVDTATLAEYNKRHQGEQGFNPVTKMGRLSGGGLFVERAVLGEDGKAIMDPVVQKGANGRPVIVGQKPRVSIEAIVPEKMRERMSDFRGWQWDDISSSFMSGADFEKVQGERLAKARDQLFNIKRATDPNFELQAREQDRKDKETAMKEAAAAGKAAEESKGGAGSSSQGSASRAKDIASTFKTISEITDPDQQKMALEAAIKEFGLGQGSSQENKVRTIPYADSLMGQGMSQQDIDDVSMAYAILGNPNAPGVTDDIRSAAQYKIKKFERNLTPTQKKRMDLWKQGK